MAATPFRGRKVEVTRLLNAVTENQPYLRNEKAYELETWFTDVIWWPASFACADVILYVVRWSCLPITRQWKSQKHQKLAGRLSVTRVSFRTSSKVKVTTHSLTRWPTKTRKSGMGRPTTTRQRASNLVYRYDPHHQRAPWHQSESLGGCSSLLQGRGNIVAARPTTGPYAPYALISTAVLYVCLGCDLLL